YQKAKVYNDGSHFIAMPPENFPRPKRRYKPKSKREESPDSPKAKFETAYSESQSLPKRERKKYIKEKLQGTFPNEKHEKEFIESNIERKKINAAKRRVRLMRKVYLQEWNYFVTFTFSGELHTEETFKEKLRNTLKHMVSRKGWKYIGVWERSPEKQRLHFHGIFYIPPNAMIGELVEVKDYSTKSHRMQTTFQNTHFQKYFGRNDFKELCRREDIMQSVRYLLKYIEKSNERLVYGGKLPTYFVSDILDDDIICPYGVDDRKAILFDNFTCIDEGCIVGQASEEVIKQMPKCN
ncbi:MAG: hypothetical protein HFE25_03250, partial [Clostridia bacterium]|nr:hypothetical protein [Clostridia bacterium]